MPYLDATKKAAIKANFNHTLPHEGLATILDEVAAAILADASGLESMPAEAGTAEANKLAQLGANKELDQVHAEALYLGAGAGTLIAATAAEINKLSGVTVSTAEINALAGLAQELPLLEGLTVNAAELNAIAVNPGLVAVGAVRIESAVQDEETVTIGADLYEFDTHDSETLANQGAIRVDVSGGSTVKSQGTLTLAAQPTAGDTMTIGTTVYTFVPDGTANAAGEINIGTDLADCKLEVVNALEGDDGWNSAHPLVTCAAAFAGNDLVLTALAGGTAGDLIATTETFTDVGNIFDANTLGTTTAGVDPTAGEASDALLGAINASGTEPITAIDIDDNELLLVQDEVGADTTAMAETMGGANNAVDSAFHGGAAGAQLKVASVARAPSALEVATGNFHVALDFVPSVAFVQARVTATGALKAWDGAFSIVGGDNPYIHVDNSGNTDWAATDTLYVIAFG